MRLARKDKKSRLSRVRSAADIRSRLAFVPTRLIRPSSTYTYTIPFVSGSGATGGAGGEMAEAAPPPADAASAPAAVTRDGVKIILLGDSAVGKSKLVERFLMDG
jgi:hypothetical protein